MSEEPKAPIPAKLAALIIKVAGEVPALRKEDENLHQKYSYVSIDGYYETVATIATEAGLFWSIREHSSPKLVVVEGEKNGNVTRTPVFLFTYVFDVFSAAGESVPGYDIVCVPHPWQGAQTSGSARSYADKLFMRTMFKVVTGEADADAADQQGGFEPAVGGGFDMGTPAPQVPAPPSGFDMGGQPAPMVPNAVMSPPAEQPPVAAQPAPAAEVAPVAEVPVAATTSDLGFQIGDGAVFYAAAVNSVAPAEMGAFPVFKPAEEFPEGEETAVRTVTEVFVHFVDSCPTVDALTNFWVMNEGAHNYVKERSPTEYDRIRTAFANRKAEFPQQEGAPA